ncbi:hypothetical protein AB6A40_005492 [Gnathostoma spinigerum]|uniref:Tudor domain-containing protein n=1 Tax=Gnathostoma spinigerum TaxID=75299 RepID=A0ABD6EFR1_9BILA
MAMTEIDELTSYKIQLKQVEAALLAEPDNDELLKLKADLDEIIALEKDLNPTAAEQNTPTETPSSSRPKKEIQWKVGDRCLAPSSNGQKFLAVIDGFIQEDVAVTFVGKGTKTMVKMSDLTLAPNEGNKSYVWDNSNKNHHRKSEWQMERERRRARALKKEQRKKNLEEARENEKNKWLSFNAKASSRMMKGFKRPTASGSAPDGPAWGVTSQTSISSRRDLGAFKSTQRGNMDSLF